MRIAHHERVALGVAVLLLAAGAGVRFLRPAPPVEWTGVAAAGDASSTQVADSVARELARARRAAMPLAPGERIDPNTAPAVELERLPGIGPATAERIVAFRQANGPYRSTADLEPVYGIGGQLLEAIAPHLTLPAAPRSAGDAASGGETAPLNLNTAGPGELETLPGIGPVLAERIVRWREEHGPFDSVAELSTVPGIGQETLDELAPLLHAGT